MHARRQGTVVGCPPCRPSAVLVDARGRRWARPMQHDLDRRRRDEAGRRAQIATPGRLRPPGRAASRRQRPVAGRHGRRHRPPPAGARRRGARAPPRGPGRRRAGPVDRPGGRPGVGRHRGHRGRRDHRAGAVDRRAGAGALRAGGRDRAGRGHRDQAGGRAAPRGRTLRCPAGRDSGPGRGGVVDVGPGRPAQSRSSPTCGATCWAAPAAASACATPCGPATSAT